MRSSNMMSIKTPEPIKRKLTIYIDVKTSFNIETYFEALITSKIKSIDIIQAIITKLNNFVFKLNRMNKFTYLSYGDYCDDLTSDLAGGEPSVVQLRILPSSNIKFNTSCQIVYKPLDTNSNQYCLVVVLFDMSEMILVENFFLANLSTPWSNGKFYLREKNFLSIS